VLVDDLTNVGQAEAGTQGLAREERVKGVIKTLHSETRSGVADGHFNPTTVHDPHADFDRPAGRHGFTGVEKQIEKGLAETLGVTPHHGSRRAICEPNLDADCADLRLHNRNQSLDEFAEIDFITTQRLRPDEREHVENAIVEAFDLSAHDVGELAPPRVVLEPAPQHGQGAGHRSERVFELVDEL